MKGELLPPAAVRRSPTQEWTTELPRPLCPVSAGTDECLCVTNTQNPLSSFRLEQRQTREEEDEHLVLGEEDTSVSRV